MEKRLKENWVSLVLMISMASVWGCKVDMASDTGGLTASADVETTFKTDDDEAFEDSGVKIFCDGVPIFTYCPLQDEIFVSKLAKFVNTHQVDIMTVCTTLDVYDCDNNEIAATDDGENVTIPGPSHGNGGGSGAGSGDAGSGPGAGAGAGAGAGGGAPAAGGGGGGGGAAPAPKPKAVKPGGARPAKP